MYSQMYDAPVGDQRLERFDHSFQSGGLAQEFPQGQDQHDGQRQPQRQRVHGGQEHIAPDLHEGIAEEKTDGH